MPRHPARQRLSTAFDSTAFDIQCPVMSSLFDFHFHFGLLRLPFRGRGPALKSRRLGRKLTSAAPPRAPREAGSTPETAVSPPLRPRPARRNEGAGERPCDVGQNAHLDDRHGRRAASSRAVMDMPVPDLRTLDGLRACIPEADGAAAPAALAFMDLDAALASHADALARLGRAEANFIAARNRLGNVPAGRSQ